MSETISFVRFQQTNQTFFMFLLFRVLIPLHVLRVVTQIVTRKNRSNFELHKQKINEFVFVKVHEQQQGTH